MFLDPFDEFRDFMFQYHGDVYGNVSSKMYYLNVKNQKAICDMILQISSPFFIFQSNLLVKK